MKTILKLFISVLFCMSVQTSSAGILTIGFSENNLLIKQTDGNDKEAQVTSSSGKVLEFNYTYFLSQGSTIFVNLSQSTGKILEDTSIDLNSYDYKLSRIEPGYALRGSFGGVALKVVSKQSLYLDISSSNIKVKQARINYGGGQLYLATQIKGPYSLTLNVGYFNLINGGKILSDRIEKGYLLTSAIAFRFTTKDFIFDLFSRLELEKTELKYQTIKTTTINIGIKLHI